MHGTRSGCASGIAVDQRERARPLVGGVLTVAAPAPPSQNGKRKERPAISSRAAVTNLCSRLSTITSALKGAQVVICPDWKDVEGTHMYADQKMLTKEVKSSSPTIESARCILAN
jgi:hypothetical protein